MKKKFATKSLIGCAAVGVLVGMTSIAQASAFQLWEQGEGDLGDYHAGAAAIADDASTEFYNSAGLVRLTRPEISTGVVYIGPIIKFRGTIDENDSSLSPVYGDNAGTRNYVPNFHYAMPLGDRFAFGFGVTVPVGLASDYGNDSVLRYAGTESTLQIINIGPSLAYKVTKKFSLGAGVDFQKLYAEFDEYAGISSSPDYDTELTNHLYNWAYGFHVGALYQFTDDTRIGLAYRGKVVHHATGASVFEGPLTMLSTNRVRTNNLEGDLISPGTTTLSFFQQLNPLFSWMATVDYTQWGAFNNLRLQHVATAGGDTMTINVPQHFRNTWNVGLGTILTLNKTWQLKFGTGYDQSPVTRKYRTIQVPDNNRLALACGFHFQADKHLGIDVGYAHFFLRKSRVNSTITASTETVTVDGHVNSYANNLGAQVTYRF